MSRDSDTTRTRILRSAWKLLESGEKSRMADIARQVGISRQALYLHFPNRADLLIETVRFMDREGDVAGRMAAVRAAGGGIAHLLAFVEAWGDYIPAIQGISRALRQASVADAEAALAWQNRLDAIHEGCARAVAALVEDGVLAPGLGMDEAADLLWAQMSVETWEALVQRQGWTQAAYVAAMQRSARAVLVTGG